MNRSGRNLLVLFHHKIISKKETDLLNSILLSTESPESFCLSHELVDRNRITTNKRKILKECRRNGLRTFRFLINKN